MPPFRRFAACAACVASFAGAAAPAAAASLSGPVVDGATGRVYHLLASADWSTSEAEARAMGAHLVTIDDAAENAWVAQTFGSWGGVPRALWIGLTDAAVEGQWVWTSGAPLGYANWGPSEPNDHLGGEDWAHIFPSGESRYPTWNDAPDAAGAFGYVFNGVVEMPAVPEPASAATMALGLALLAGLGRTARRGARAAFLRGAG